MRSKAFGYESCRTSIAPRLRLMCTRSWPCVSITDFDFSAAIRTHSFRFDGEVFAYRVQAICALCVKLPGTPGLIR